MDKSKLPNPYDYANPVRDGNLFAGRGAELSRISYTLDQITPARPTSYLAISGERASGKTSLLNMVDIMAGQKEMLVVRVDLVPGDGEPLPFFTKLFEELVTATAETGELVTDSGTPITARTIRRIINGQLDDHGIPLEFPESLSHLTRGGQPSETALRADLCYLASRIARPIVVLIDEAQELAENDSVLSIIRTTGMRVSGYLFVLAGTPDLLQRVNTIFSPIIRQFEMIHLKRFTESDEVQACVAAPLEKIGLDFKLTFESDDEQIFDLIRLTDGSPYEIQLFCHTMFTRWQMGSTPRMSLTPEVLEDVRSLLEVNQGPQLSPVIAAARKLPAPRLSALNLLCAAIGSARFEDIWFINNLTLDPEFSREELEAHFDALIYARLIEINPEGYINFTGDQFEGIYIKVWSRSLNETARRRHTLSTGSMHRLLTYYLEELLHTLSPDGMFCLETCCYKMSQENVSQAIEALSVLDPAAQKFDQTITFIHGAVTRANIPAELELTTIQCEYGGETATRWLVNRTGDSFDLAVDPRFCAVANRLSPLGGRLSAQRSVIPIRPWQEVLGWLKQMAPSAHLAHMADHHVTAAFNAYGRDSRNDAIRHLRMAQDLIPTWHAANNLGYILMTSQSFDDAIICAEEATALATDTVSRALSRYNKAIALLGSCRALEARDTLLRAENELNTLEASDQRFSYLIVPEIIDGTILLRERTDCDLKSSLAESLEISYLAIRVPSLLQGVRLITA